MESSSFYITCPSNASMKLYPGNTQASFKINLPKRLYLNSKYEVGLAQIQYPVSWLTFSKDVEHICYVISKEKQYKVFVKTARYNSVDEIIHVVLSSIWNQVKEVPRQSFDIWLDMPTHKVEYSIADGIKLVFSKELNEAFGFVSGYALSGKGEAPFTADAQRGLHSLYVYCNIVDSQIVGDVYAPLLQTVAIKGERSQVVSETFDRPHYVPVNTDEVSVIEINIKDDTGQDISFQSGKVICKLHFRQKAI